MEIADSTNQVEGNLYFDTIANLVLLITKTESKFKSVKDYIDCTREQLEKELKISYSDSTLRLISCNNSAYYPEKTVALYIEIGVLPNGFNQSLIYFIHHKNKDIQFSFMFKKECAKESINKIDAIMKTLKLL
jgi:hypothetical protein